MSQQADAKFPTQSEPGLPPSPTLENPGQVFPQSTQMQISCSYSGKLSGNPYLMGSAFKKLADSLGDVIELLEKEEASVGSSKATEALVHKFKSWRSELDGIPIGDNVPTSTDASAAAGTQYGGGIFTE
ncbi:hypothetical protein BD779DRAFT_1469994 [Infundibulicybe gibba]|nr:hypothetical protein BD779DRAFT_1469994 [Infundibulicybe gibba]